MPIQSRDPSECFELFANHTQSLIAETLTSKTPITLLRLRDTRGVLAFQQNVSGTPKAEAIPISTHLGKLQLFLWQALEARASDGGIFTLTTTKYRYRLEVEESDDGSTSNGESYTTELFRWEFDPSQKNEHPPYHLHIFGAIPVGPRGSLNLRAVHIPTGRILLEDIIRFLITNLGFKPPCGDRWSGVLQESERKFHEEFRGTSRRTIQP